MKSQHKNSTWTLQQKLMLILKANMLFYVLSWRLFRNGEGSDELVGTAGDRCFQRNTVTSGG